MNLQHIYWAFTGVISTKDCNKIIKIARQQKLEKGKVFLHDKKAAAKLRHSNVCFLNDPFIYKTLHPYLHIANKNAGWNFQHDYSEACQFTTYKKNHHYNWHQDCVLDQYTTDKNPDYQGKIRKLSMTLTLSDPKAYQGGDLQFYIPHPLKTVEESTVVCQEIRKRGAIVVFPSFMYHRIVPVTKGTRHALVIWCLGQNYK